jgi:zinc protease
MKTNKIKGPVFWVINAILLTAMVSACAPSAVDFAGLGKADDLVPLTSRAFTGTLPNGLRYFILENSRPENRAHLALVVNAGSVLEKDDERGFAHFVEHLAFNDTPRFPKLELIEYLRSLGMRFGADANAYTYYDETVYHFDVPVENSGGIKRIPDRALAILDDWTYAVSFLPEDVKSESLVVLEEHRTRLGAMDRVRKITLPVLFEGSAYADRNPIGLPEIIQNAESRQVKGFYDRWYTSDNMALVFTGDFDGGALEEELSNHFKMPAAEQPVNRPMYELPPPKKGNFHVEIITDPELTSANFMIYFKQKAGTKRGTLAYYRESLIDYLIDTMLTMRFEEITSDPEAAAVEHWGGIWRWSTNARFYSMGTYPKTGGAEAALRELLLEKESMRRYGFTESELERAKLNLISYMEELLSEKDKRDSRYYLNGFVSYFIHGEDMADIEWETDAVYSLLPGIGLKEITEAAKKYFSYNDCIVFLIAPQAEAENLPSKERIKAVFKETARAKIARKKSQSFSSELLDKPPLPGSITGESTDRETGALILTLNNGAKIILKETENKNNEVILYAMARGGTLNAADDKAVSADLASEMAGVSGLGPYSRTELINKLAGKQVSFSFWASNYYRGIQGSSTTKDLKTLFEVIHLFFTNPNLDENAVAAMLDQYRTNLIYQDDDPQSVFSRELNKTINNNHPRFKPLEAGDMDKVSVEQALEFIKNCVNPGDYTFVFTGNLDYGEIKEFSAQYIASIPNTGAMNAWTDPGIKRPKKTEKIIYKGKDDKCMVYLAWFMPGPAGFDEEKNMTAALLTEYMDIMLTDEIREKIGGVYSISAGASISTIPSGEYRLSVFFQCNPARAEELIAVVKERVTGIGTRPLNQDTFNKSREAMLKEYENSLQINNYIAQSYANSSVLYNTPLGRLNSRPDVISAVRPENVQALCRQMLVSAPVQVVLYPERGQ